MTNKTCLWETEQRTLGLQEQRLQIRLEARKLWAKSSRAEETNQEAQKRLEAQRQWAASKRQCQTAQQRVNHEYDYRPTSDDTKSTYQLIMKITIFEKHKK